MSHIGRAAAAAIILSVFAAEASAATMVRPGSATVATERGVTVIRGAKPAAPLVQPAPPARAACPATEIAVTRVWPARRLRQHGFLSGDGLVTPSMRAARRPHTTGFYADRIAAGL